ncbi:MAG: hypothetical protein A3G32_08505 [Deltaproteobacteria bacterium RIFCSPLOWO2_12_FULL_40_28]|nr:MAG: hypothetical protein A3C45_01205 [Deltaproteobacteria bacterium RIFCSPHIGHO2_02_FULL_40_28]OGQ20944.1 MAG: hypothetical protein A3E27_03870 [Deltaproteobacteria bacterium RIFCSPHIGHO2_12_FULL_40_32]OGQ39345.1 MAG: hypothetical protein A3I69_05230 [Deltaproteobacteria bacterium RIFCSPLOWO2_02_FULL_40_36]OGQ54626.1 MAG: hypothetical protein A3G32_08505 [Deltaproteobacteria bacterium RIFCSPLOWO2_12_FULL_40_28]
MKCLHEVLASDLQSFYNGLAVKMKTNSGMTIKELIVVIFLMATITVGSIPLFYWLKTQSRERELHEFVEVLKSGIAAWHYKSVVTQNTDVYPAFLDINPVEQKCENCFQFILPRELSDHLWYKKGPTEYLYSTNGNYKNITDFSEAGDFQITYTPLLGQVSIKKL